ncbi:hypothetical protein MPSEU_000226200 [Mayamaea pseudoterrestris]|nr:hypothetical protein MPSEU_000226200 [Mayamaea pseudoterrestris]
MSHQRPKSPFFHPHSTVVVARRSSSIHANDDSDNSNNEPIETKSGLVGCTSNMMACIIGSGIIGIPYAMKQSGYGAGLLLILLVGLVAEKSLRLLVETAKHVQAPTYETLAHACYGLTGFRFILINMFVISFGAMVSYLMIVKDSFSFLLDINDATLQNLLLLGVSVCVQLPLACLRDMADLDKASRLSVLIVVMLVGVVAYCAPWQETLVEQGGLARLMRQDTIHYDSIFVGLGVLSFAFECQESAFLVAGSLNHPTRQRWSIVTKCSLGVCVCLALVCGSAGYLGFMDLREGNILNNFGHHSWAGKVSHGLLGATMFASYPLASFVARHVCVVLLFEGQSAQQDNDTSILDRADRRIALTVALYVAAVTIACYCRDLGSVLALAGVVGGSCIAYFAPGMLYLGVHGGRFLELVQNSWFFPVAKSEANGNTKISVTVAVETTPLVKSQQEGEEVKRQQQIKNEKQRVENRTIMGVMKTLIYYIAGFPIWCAIAKIGKETLTKHVQKLVRENVHPIRIGNVQFSLAKVLDDGKIDADPKVSTVVTHPEYRQHYSEPLEGSGRHKDDKPDNATKFGDAGNGLSTLEPDPQEQPPTWLDFGVAIFYILFGIVALTAGLYSLFYADDDIDDRP